MMSSKPLAILLLLLAGSQLSIAQIKCKLDIDDADAPAHLRTRFGTNVLGVLGSGWKITLKQTGDKYLWSMQVKWNIHFTDPIGQGQLIYLKLANGNLLQLAADKDYRPTYSLYPGNVIVSNYLPGGDLSENDIKLLSESPLANIKITISGQDIEPQISVTQGRNVMNTALCLMKPAN